MHKVLLLNPPIYFDKEGSPHSLDVSVAPLGLLYLASYISGHSQDIGVEIIDIATEKTNLHDIKKLIEQNEYLAIGITAMTPQLQGAFELATEITKTNTPPKVFLGGAHVSADPEFVNRNHGVFDFAITGEGEVTFLESLQKLIKQEEIAKIETGKTLESLEGLDLNVSKYLYRDKYNQSMSLLYSRGCPFNCYFCSRPAIDKRVRHHDIKDILNEIKKDLPHNKGKLDFQDDTFTINRSKAIELCQEIIKSGLDLKWGCNTRIDLLDEELIRIMSLSGCNKINFGIESGSERVRYEIVNKGKFSNDKIKEIFSLCRKYKIKIACYFIIGHPGETKEELLQTRHMIEKSKIDLLGLSLPTPFPGSVLYDIAKEKGIINDNVIDDFAKKRLGWGYDGNYPVLLSNKMSREYIFKQMKIINGRFYLKFSFLFNKLKEDITSFSKLKKDFLDLMSLLSSGVPSRKPYKKNK